MDKVKRLWEALGQSKKRLMVGLSAAGVRLRAFFGRRLFKTLLKIVAIGALTLYLAGVVLEVGLFLYVRHKKDINLEPFLAAWGFKDGRVYEKNYIQISALHLRLEADESGRQHLAFFIPTLAFRRDAQEAFSFGAQAKDVWMQFNLWDLSKLFVYGFVLDSWKVRHGFGFEALSAGSASFEVYGHSLATATPPRALSVYEGLLSQSRQQMMLFLQTHFFDPLLIAGMDTIHLDNVAIAWSLAQPSLKGTVRLDRLFFGRTMQADTSSPARLSFFHKRFADITLSRRFFWYTQGRHETFYEREAFGGAFDLWGGYDGWRKHAVEEIHYRDFSLPKTLEGWLRARGMTSVKGLELFNVAGYDFAAQGGVVSLGVRTAAPLVLQLQRPLSLASLSLSHTLFFGQGFSESFLEDLDKDAAVLVDSPFGTADGVAGLRSFHRFEINAQLAEGHRRFFLDGHSYPLRTVHVKGFWDTAADVLKTDTLEAVLEGDSRSAGPTVEGSFEIHRLLAHLDPSLSSRSLGSADPLGVEAATGAPLEADLRMEIHRLPLRRLGDYWPVALVPEARTWAAENLFGVAEGFTATGLLQKGTLHMHWAGSSLRTLQSKRYEGILDFTDATVRFLPKAPLGRGVEGQASYNQDHFNIAFQKGRTDDNLRLAGGRLDFDYRGAQTLMALNLSLDGLIRSYQPVIEGLAGAEMSGMKGVDGHVKASVRLQMSLGNHVPVDFKSYFTVQDGRMRFADGTLENVTAQGVVDLKESQLTAKGQFQRDHTSGAPVDFEADGRHSLVGADQEWTAAFRLPASQIGAYLSAPFIQRYLGLEGHAAGRVQWVENRQGEKADVVLDLRGLGWALPVLGRKDPAAAGQLGLNWSAPGRRNWRLDSLNLKSANLSLQSRPVQADGSRLIEGRLNNHPIAVRFRQNAAGWHLEAPIPLSVSESVESYLKTTVIPQNKAALAWVDRLKNWPIWHRGHSTILVDYDYEDSVAVDWHLYNKPLAPAHFSAKYMLHPLELDISDALNQKNRPRAYRPRWYFSLATDDAASLAKALELDYIRQGRGALDLILRHEGDWAGHLVLENLRLQGVSFPLVAQISRVFSIPLVDNTYPFQKASVSFLLSPKTLKIGEARLEGSSAMMTAARYDFKTTRLVGRGVYVPLWHLNRMTQWILPLRGVINGQDTVGGLGATRFYLAGTAGHYSISTKVGSSLVPFFLKELFFSDEDSMNVRVFQFDAERGIR